MKSNLSIQSVNADHKKLIEVFNPILREIECSQMAKVNLETILGIDYGLQQAREMVYRLFEYIKDYLTQVLMDISIMQFLAIKKDGDLSIQHTQKIMLSFCRSIQSIPPDKQLDQYDVDRFLRTIDDADERFGRLTGKEYFEKSRTASFNLLGIKYALYNLDRLERLLFRIGSPYNVLSNDERGTPVFILGNVKEIINEDFTIYHVIEEFARSPHYTLAIAASGYGDRKMMIRQESIKVVMFNKWEKFFEISSSEKIELNEHPEDSIVYNLRRKTLESGGMRSISDFIKVKDNFEAMIFDGIVYHEYGHKVAKRDRPIALNSMASSFYKTYNIIEVIEEAIADWCPTHGNLMGGMARFVERYRMNDPSVNRDFYAYLSDNWFLSNKEQELVLFTEIITALAVHHIRDDGAIDFEGIETNIDRYYEYLRKMKCLILENIQNILREGTYTIAGISLCFEELAGYVLRMYQHCPDDYTRQEDLFYKYDFWLNLFHYAEKFSPETHIKIQDKLDIYADEVSRDILEIVSEGSGPVEYGTLRDYIHQRYETIGVLHHPFVFDPADLVERVGSRIGMLEIEKASALDCINSALNGWEFDISINYEAEPNPFIMTIQEIMRMTGAGNIDEPMYLDIWVEDTTDRIEVYTKIQLELKNLFNKICAGMIISIKRLTMNKEYADMINKALTDEVDLLTGKTLLDYVLNVDLQEMDELHIADAYITTQTGIIDWNTACAVGKFNMELRLEAYSKLYTIDGLFLKALAAEYYSLHEPHEVYIQEGSYENKNRR